MAHFQFCLYQCLSKYTLVDFGSAQYGCKCHFYQRQQVFSKLRFVSEYPGWIGDNIIVGMFGFGNACRQYTICFPNGKVPTQECGLSLGWRLCRWILSIRSLFVHEKTQLHGRTRYLVCLLHLFGGSIVVYWNKLVVCHVQCFYIGLYHAANVVSGIGAHDGRSDHLQISKLQNVSRTSATVYAKAIWRRDTKTQQRFMTWRTRKSWRTCKNMVWQYIGG